MFHTFIHGGILINLPVQWNNVEYPPVIKHGNGKYTIHRWFSYWNHHFEWIFNDQVWLLEGTWALGILGVLQSWGYHQIDVSCLQSIYELDDSGVPTWLDLGNLHLGKLQSFIHLNSSAIKGDDFCIFEPWFQGSGEEWGCFNIPIYIYIYTYMHT